MKIISLTAENVKRLKAVEITPAGTVQIVGGRNAQGKTSVLDSIWLALGGGPASKGTTRPIRDGEESAKVVLDLGELVVTRTWAGEKTTLTVASAEGAKFTSPQGILDKLVGRLAFDPLEFTRQPAKDQRDALLALVELPFDLADLDARRAAIFDERTECGRRGKALQGHLEALPEVDAPDAEVSSAEILAELRTAQAAKETAGRIACAVAAAQGERELARADLDAAQQRFTEAKRDELEARNRAADTPPAPDVDAIEQRLASVDQVNTAVRAKAMRTKVAADVARVRDEYAAQTATLAKLDRRKADGLAAATFPVDGLGFDATGVTFQGIPFAQASSAEQIRVSLAMAMSLNPQLRVIRILDGSLLDGDGLNLITGMAEAADYQVWIERVGDADQGAVIIEDGEVRS